MKDSKRDGCCMLAPHGQTQISVCIACGKDMPSQLASERLSRIAKDELGIAVTVKNNIAQSSSCQVIALCTPWSEVSREILRKAEVELGEDGRLKALSEAPASRADQGFVATLIVVDNREALLLAANTGTGIRNALLTLGDRLYRNGSGNLMVDAIEGAHIPAFIERHIKSDAMNCGALRFALEYWDPTTPSGIAEFADWLAGFRITDYDLLAFVRGWGTSYASERFPLLSDPQHPNVKFDFYPQLISRLHDWGIRVWASDIYMASGYTMETGTNPAMLSPCADAAKLRSFKAGDDSFFDILGDPNAIVCLSHPSAAKYYSDIVDELLVRYPGLDGLDFHIGHTFPHKICRCSACRDLAGNRDALYRCFSKVYETATARCGDIRMKSAVKIFGDATRGIVERWAEFPHLEFFCWLRWTGNFGMEKTDAPVTIGHEDGGGGLEASNSHDPNLTLAQARDYFRDYEPWLKTYVQIALRSGMQSFSWDAALQKELEHLLFFHSQLTWEPELTWVELARRWVVRSERRIDDSLIEAYRLAMEANDAVSLWGLAPYDSPPGLAQRIVQLQGLTETKYVRERVDALRQQLQGMGLLDKDWSSPPVAFDLRCSLIKTCQRMGAGKTLNLWH